MISRRIIESEAWRAKKVVEGENKKMKPSWKSMDLARKPLKLSSLLKASSLYQFRFMKI
jgi:hypothetical protein